MASKKLKAEAFINLPNGDSVLWYTIDEDGSVTWHLPQNKADAYKKAMLDRAGREFSLYIKNNPDSKIWDRAS